MHTRTSLHEDLVRLGVSDGDLVMVHAGVRSIGRVVGGVNSLIHAIFDAVGEAGTVAAYVDFEPFFEDDDEPSSIPVFDKRIAHAARDHGILHQTLRTWPGAVRSDHPDAGVVAIGSLAESITRDHPFQYGYGEGSPFERIVDTDGRVLLLGAPLDTITLLHHAEHRANIPGKRVHRYRRLMPGSQGPEWIDFEEFDTRDPVCDWLPADCFERIARGALAAGMGRTGRVGDATSHLFDGAPLVEFGVEWLQREFSRLSAAQPSTGTRATMTGESRMPMCERQTHLRAEVNAILARIDELNRDQMKALNDGDDERLMTLDKQLELTFGEKERAFGALFEHRSEHGC